MNHYYVLLQAMSLKSAPGELAMVVGKRSTEEETTGASPKWTIQAAATKSSPGELDSSGAFATGDGLPSIVSMAIDSLTTPGEKPPFAAPKLGESRKLESMQSFRNPFFARGGELDDGSDIVPIGCKAGASEGGEDAYRSPMEEALALTSFDDLTSFCAEVRDVLSLIISVILHQLAVKVAFLHCTSLLLGLEFTTIFEQASI